MVVFSSVTDDTACNILNSLDPVQVGLSGVAPDIRTIE